MARGPDICSPEKRPFNPTLLKPTFLPTPPPTPVKERVAQRGHAASAAYIDSDFDFDSDSDSKPKPKPKCMPTRTRTRRDISNHPMKYDSGLEGIPFDGLDGSDGSESSDEDTGELDLGDDILVSGFAVASMRRNADFHELFGNIPEGDYLIEDYGCALRREILIQGRLYISENHICFHANILGWITNLSIPIYEIISLEKQMTAIIPNAIQITTCQAKYSFASLLSRDTTYDLMFNIWRLARPDDNLFNGGTSGHGSLDNASLGMKQAKSASGSADDVNSVVGGGAGAVVVVGGAGTRKPSALSKHKVTQCACGKDGDHYGEIVLETIFPGTPDKIYNLMFASGFIKEFMKGGQKILDIQISDWASTSPGSKLLARKMSYIKPLNTSLGLKQTKCNIRDETIYCDFDDYMVTITTIRMPDFPSGSVFSIKTRTCIMWASAASTRVVVTTQVDWTGKSFIKGLVEKSAIDGQKVYHADLDGAMRVYIQQHQSEFVPEGIKVTAVAPIDATKAKLAESISDKTCEKQWNQRGLQWAYDMFDGAYNVAKQSTKGTLELISDAWDRSVSPTIYISIIVVLVISNLWMLTMIG